MTQSVKERSGEKAQDPKMKRYLAPQNGGQNGIPYYFIPDSSRTYEHRLVPHVNVTLSLENHQDGVYLHRHWVTLSLQAVLVCSKADTSMLRKNVTGCAAWA